MNPTSDRLSYRLLTPNEWELLLDLDQDPEVMKYVGVDVSTREDYLNFYNPRYQKYYNPPKGWGLWGFFEKENGKENGKKEFLGWILVRPNHFFDKKNPPEYHNLEIGWRMHKRFWGKGYGTEAARAVVDYLLLINEEMVSIVGTAMEENVGSTRIMEKLGMGFVEKQIEKLPDGGELEVVVYYRKLR